MDNSASWRMYVTVCPCRFYHYEFQMVQVVFDSGISVELIARVVNKIKLLKCINKVSNKPIEYFYTSWR